MCAATRLGQSAKETPPVPAIAASQLYEAGTRMTDYAVETRAVLELAKPALLLPAVSGILTGEAFPQSNRRQCLDRP